MAQPFDKLQNRLTDLPNPELNPLLNPILGRNLGRWAQVYFTSPPEKREEAVNELLRELEGDASRASSTAESTAAYSQSLKTHTVPEFASCPACSQPNGKWQRYCGMCGARLSVEEKPDRQDAPALVTEFPGNGHREHEKVTEPVPEQYPTLSLFATAETESRARAAEENGNSDARWLQDQDLSDAPNEGGSRLGVYALAVCSILVLAGVIYYAQFRSQHTVVQDLHPANLTQEASPQPTSTSQGSSPQTPRTANSQVGQQPAVARSAATSKTTPSYPTTSPETRAPNELRSSQSSQPTDAPAQHAAPRNLPAATAPSRAAINAFSSPTGRAPVPTSAAVPAATEKPVGGTVELATAQQYLSGKGRPRDSAAAATWLWAAVRKENPTAVLLLSQLYIAGDGVNKSCEQARVLLMSAARKNVPGASEQLNNLQASGCK